MLQNCKITTENCLPFQKIRQPWDENQSQNSEDIDHQT